jgi:hypothetical protein
MGWTSATIARAGFPPPKQLTAAGERRLRIVSTVLVALGLTNTIRLLAIGKRPQKRGTLLRPRSERRSASAGGRSPYRWRI